MTPLYLLFVCQWAVGDNIVKYVPKRLVNNLRPLASDDVQTLEANRLVRRILPRPGHHERFVIRIQNDGDYGRLEVANNTAYIMASSGVMATWTFHEYLRRFCHAHISWEHRIIDIPDDLPITMDKTFTLSPPDAVRFYQNPCLYGYSFAYWTWKQWSDHLDWMALNGINLALALEGQELIWIKTYRSILGDRVNLTDSFFTGKVFLPWNRMGNLKGWDGPLSQRQMEKAVSLQHKILKRMRRLGITPVIPAFNGIVPDEVIRRFHKVKHYTLRQWGHFPAQYSGLNLISPTENIYGEILNTFNKLYQEEYGETSHFYSFDTFNEMSPPEGSRAFLRRYNHILVDRLKSMDSNFIWVMQGWMFRNQTYWTTQRAQAYIKAIPRNRVLVLDSASTTSPQYPRLNSYFGRPFVYCMLHNYGGTMGLYGKSETVNHQPYEARNQVSHVGMGLTPEGIHNSYVMYELMLETFWRTEPIADLPDWFSTYSRRRYGRNNAMLSISWRTLEESVYNCCGLLNETKKEFRFHGRNALTLMPHIGNRLPDKIWYDPDQLQKAWKQLILGAMEISNTNKVLPKTLLFDLVDVTQNVLTDLVSKKYSLLMEAYHHSQNEAFANETKEFVDILDAMEELLATNERFLLGRYLAQAKRRGDLYGAKNIITLWGPSGNILDYASKSWSGLVKDYYKPRWQLFFSLVKDSMKSGMPFDQGRFWKKFLKNIALPFNRIRKKYPRQPKGDTLSTVIKIFQRYGD